MPRRPSARLELEPADRESGLRVEVDALPVEDDGVDDWRADGGNCLGGAKESPKYF